MWQIILFLFGVSIFTSKSGLSFFAFCAIVGAFGKLNFRQIWLENKRILLIAGLYPLLFFLNLFSIEGWPSSITILHAWIWPLLAFPALIVFHNRNDQKYFFLGSLVGILIAMVYSFYLLGTNEHFNLSQIDRPVTFWDVGRWGVFLGVACLAMIGFLGLPQFNKMNWKKQVFFFLFLSLSLFSFILTKTRGPLLGVSAGLILFLVFHQGIRKLVLLIFLLMAFFIGVSPNMKDRVASIVDIQKGEKGEITATNISNSGRLHMWKVALDFFQEQPFFGTGFDSTGEPLQNFLERQTEEYRRIYTGGEFSYNDQHSSYLNFLVQNGIIFSCIMWAVFFLIIYKGVLHYFRTREQGTLIALAILAAYLIIFIFYATLQSFDSVFFFMALAYLALLPALRSAGLQKLPQNKRITT